MVIVNGLILALFFTIALPYTASPIWCSENMVKLNHSNEEDFHSNNEDRVTNVANVSFEKIIDIYDLSTNVAPISRSQVLSRKEIKTTESTDTDATYIDDVTLSHLEKIATPPTVEEPGDSQSIIREVALFNGCTQSETEILLKIANSESSFDIDAVSPNGDCVGLFQLDSNKGTYDQRVDPYWNTTRAISYMKDRYGSIESAYVFRKNHNWY